MWLPLFRTKRWRTNAGRSESGAKLSAGARSRWTQHRSTWRTKRTLSSSSSSSSSSLSLFFVVWLLFLFYFLFCFFGYAGGLRLRWLLFGPALVDVFTGRQGSGVWPLQLCVCVGVHIRLPAARSHPYIAVLTRSARTRKSSGRRATGRKQRSQRGTLAIATRRRPAKSPWPVPESLWRRRRYRPD